MALLLISKIPLETPATESLPFFIATENQKTLKDFYISFSNLAHSTKKIPPFHKKILIPPPQKHFFKRKNIEAVWETQWLGPHKNSYSHLQGHFKSVHGQIIAFFIFLSFRKILIPFMSLFCGLCFFLILFTW